MASKKWREENSTAEAENEMDITAAWACFGLKVSLMPGFAVLSEHISFSLDGEFLAFPSALYFLFFLSRKRTMLQESS